MSVSAKILADSIYETRVTTMEVVMHRFVLAEFNTHRVFSRNSASSRAIPFEKQLNRVLEDPAIPMVWASEKPGMQGGDEIPEGEQSRAFAYWMQARNQAANEAKRLHDLGVHKSIVNRLLEPFMWHTVVVTSTEWENFFNQRCSPLAQPEMRAAAEAMRDALEVSTPRALMPGEWHLPYIQEVEYSMTDIDTLTKLSAARCARVSYKTFDGTVDRNADLALYEKLVSQGHWSPLEHVCRPHDMVGRKQIGNLEKWTQLRHIEEFRRAKSSS
jgi:thymidylate synthase ThyX